MFSADVKEKLLIAVQLEFWILKQFWAENDINCKNQTNPKAIQEVLILIALDYT